MFKFYIKTTHYILVLLIHDRKVIKSNFFNSFIKIKIHHQSRFYQRVFLLRFLSQVLVAEGCHGKELEHEAEEDEACEVHLVGGELRGFEHKHLVGSLT